MRRRFFQHSTLGIEASKLPFLKLPSSPGSHTEQYLMKLIRLLHSLLRCPVCPHLEAYPRVYGLLYRLPSPEAISRFPGGYAFNCQSPSYASVYLEISMHFYGLEFPSNPMVFRFRGAILRRPAIRAPTFAHTSLKFPIQKGPCQGIQSFLHTLIASVKTARVAYLAGESR